IGQRDDSVVLDLLDGRGFRIAVIPISAASQTEQKNNQHEQHGASVGLPPHARWIRRTSGLLQSWFHYRYGWLTSAAGFCQNFHKRARSFPFAGAINHTIPGLVYAR